MGKFHQVIVIGAGPCGISTAVALKKAGVDVAIIEPAMPGGKINIAPRVDNYPGYYEIPGPKLAWVFYERLQESGVELIPEEVLSLNKKDDLFTLHCSENDYTANAVVIASGTKERKLGFENEDRLFGHGLSYCALCDGHFFKNQPVAVIGGGNAALKEALYLANIVSALYVIHRRDEFRGNERLVAELKAKDNVTVLTPYIPLEILEEEEKVSGLKILNKATNEVKTLSIRGLFPLIGQIPNTKFVHIPNVLDEYNTIPVDKNMATAVPGLFAGGDVLPRIIRQIYLAQHDGETIAKSTLTFLKGENHA